MIEGLVEGDAEAGAETPTEQALLALAARLAAVAAIALPVCGFGVRAVAFELCGRIGSPGPLHLAAAQSIADLTVTGLRPVAVTIPIFLGALLNAYGLQMRSKTPREQPLIPERLRRPVGALAMIAGVVMLVYGVLLSPPLLVLLMAVSVPTVVSGLHVIYRKRRSLRVVWTWPILIVCLVASTLACALDYRDVPLAAYTLDSSTGVPSGWYLELGRTSDTVYLLSCTSTSTAVLGVTPASILRAQHQPGGARSAPPTTVLDLLLGNAAMPIGLWTVCP